MALFNFTFQADVWGTVSDWVMIVVTLATAYFLWQTLKSQKEVQQTQNRLLKIEQLKLREDFKPNLKYNRVELGGRLSDETKSIISIAVKNINISPAINFNIIHEATHGGTFVIAKPIRQTLNLNDEHEVLNFVINDKKEENLDRTIYFTVEYNDVAGTKYTQTVRFDAFAGQEEFKTYDPKVLKEVEL